jgi:hypothetical protein
MDASWMSHGHKLMYNESNLYMHVDKKIVRSRGRLKCNANGNYRNNRSVKTRAQRPLLYYTKHTQSNRINFKCMYCMMYKQRINSVLFLAHLLRDYRLVAYICMHMHYYVTHMQRPPPSTLQLLHSTTKLSTTSPLITIQSDSVLPPNSPLQTQYTLRDTSRTDSGHFASSFP